MGSDTMFAGAGRILIAGNQTLNAASPLTLPAGVTLDAGGGVLTIAGDTVTVAAGATLPLTGDMINSDLVNQGTVNVLTGASTIASTTFANGGTLALESSGTGNASLNVSGALTSSGLITLDNTYTLASRTETLNVTGLLTNAGVLQTLRSGAGGSIILSGNISQAAGGLIDIDENATINVEALDLSLGSVDIAAGITLTLAPQSGTATTTFADGAWLGGGTLAFTGTQSLNIEGAPTTLANLTFDMSAGTVTVGGSGSAVVASSAELMLGGGTFNAGLTNNGTLRLSQGTTHVNSTPQNNNEMFLEATASGGATANLNAGLVNSGSLTLDNVYALATRSVTLNVPGGVLTNDGTINILRSGAGGATTISGFLTQGASGVINVDHNLTISALAVDLSLGHIDVATGQTITVNPQAGAVTTLSAGTWGGDGAVTFTGNQTVNFEGASTTLTNLTFSMSGANVTVGGAGTAVVDSTATLLLGGGTFNADLTNNGITRIHSGSTSFNSRPINDADFHIEGIAAGSTTVNLNNGFDNADMLTLDNIYALAARNVTINISGGDLDNQGTLLVQRTGAGGAVRINGDISQGVAGLIDIDHDLTVDTLAFDLSQGTLDIATGEVLTVTGQTSAAITTFGNGTYLGDGTIDFNGTQTVNFDASPTTLENLVFDLVGSNITVGGTGGVVVGNTATFLLGGGSVNVPLTNNGTTRVQNGTTNFNVTPNNTADLFLEGTIVGPATMNFNNGFDNSGTLTIDNAYATAARNVAVTVTGGALNNTGTLNVVQTGGGGTYTLTGALDNSGTVNIDKTFTLAGDGITHINQVGGNIAISSGRTLTITGAGSTFTNDGTVSLAGVSGVTSATTILDVTGLTTFQNNGSLTGIGTVNGSITGNAPSVGSSPGLITINGDYTMEAGSVFVAELAGEAAGTGYDQLAVSDRATLGGEMSVVLLDGYTLREGATFLVLTAGLLASRFSRVEGLDQDNTWVLDLEYRDDAVALTAVATTQSGSALDDQIEGSAGRDIVVAGAGDDTITAISGSDVVYGQAGDDVIYASGDFDRVDGGDGTNVLVLSGPGGTDLASRIDRIDVLQLDEAEVVLSPADVAGIVDGVNNATGEADSLVLRGVGDLTLEGGFTSSGLQLVDAGEGPELFELYEAGEVTVLAEAGLNVNVDVGESINLAAVESLLNPTLSADLPGMPPPDAVLSQEFETLDWLLGGETSSAAFATAQPTSVDIAASPLQMDGLIESLLTPPVTDFLA